MMSETITLTAAYCLLVLLKNDTSAVMTPRAYNALLSMMTNIMGQRRVLLLRGSLTVRKICQANCTCLWVCVKSNPGEKGVHKNVLTQIYDIG